MESLIKFINYNKLSLRVDFKKNRIEKQIVITSRYSPDNYRDEKMRKSYSTRQMGIGKK